jgi:UDP-N-acetylmuramoylalanine--D-glutamate ligase
MSSFQTETITDFHPRWAAILNLSADHLDRHGSLGEYGAAKLRLLRNCTREDRVVYGADDPWVSAHLPRDGARPVPFASSPPANGGARAWVEDGAIYWRAADGNTARVVDLEQTALVGSHNALNAAAAVALSCLAGASVEDAAATLREFRGLPHRMQSCGEPRGIRCIDDSKATNVGATLASLGGLDRPVWLILGGRDKDSDFNRLRSRLPGRVRSVLLIGEAAGRIAASLHGAAPLRHCGTIERAVDAALADGRPGDVLLLAPACTSFDQFDDFEHRGRTFQTLVASRAAQAAP